MPGGLPDVTQRFDADTAGYVAGIAAMIAANRELVGSIAKAQAEIKALGDKTVRIDVDNSGALAKIAEVKTALDSLGDTHVSIGGDASGGMLRELRDISASMDQVTSSMGRMEDHMVVISKNAQDSSADLMMQTQILRDNADAHNAAATAAAAFAAAQRGGGGGGGAGRTALAAAAGAAAGGGGGGGGGGAPGFVPWAGGGWQAVRFWGMMGAEIASTVVPSIVAAGAAAAVGAQGFEQLQNRVTAVWTVSEALGGSLNKTAGQFFGGGNALQKAQDAAQGGVWELGGSLVRIAQSGAGGGFLGLGNQTLGMVDRGMANLVTNVTQGGIGKKLADALGGGPGYLREFGDIGANLGTAALNFAPNLPGVGADLLGGLTGATGLLRSASTLPAPLLKEFFTYEAASRWGPALLGGQGLIGRMLGLRGVGGIGGLLGRGGEALAARGLGGTLGDVGLGMMGAGDFLGALTGPETGGIGMAIQALAMLAQTMPSGAQRQMAALQAGIGGAGFTTALHPLARAITIASAGAAAAPGGLGSDFGTNQSPESAMRFGPIGPTTRDVYANAAGSFAQQLGEMVGAGPQLVTALQKLGMHGVTLANAFQLAQDAMIDIPHSFGPGGKLNKTALSQLASYVAAIGPMTQSPGAFGAAVAGQQIMSSGAMQNLSKVNQAMDSMSQIMQAGPAGMASLAATQRALPAGAMAKALTSMISPAGSAAWTQFAGTAPTSVISQMQAFNDQMRTGLTLGGLSQGQAAGLTGYELKQFLPQARQSPAALAMLMQQGAQMGIGGYYQGDPSKPGVQAANYAAAVAATKQIAMNAQQAQAAMTGMTVHLANLPAVAKQLLGQTGPAIQAQQVAKIAQDASKIQQGINIKANVGDLVSQLRAAGVQGGAALKASLDAVLAQAGVSKAVRVKIEADVSAAQAAINGLHGKTITVQAMAAGVGAVQAAINSVHGKSVTIQVTTINTTISRQIGALTAPGGVAPMTMVGGAPNMRLTAGGMQTGGMVPGSGSGDIIPAMLEPGEAIIPRYLVPLIAPILAAHRVPGFGGMPQSSASHFADGGLVPHVLGFPDPTIQGKAGQFAFTLIDGITKALNAAGAKKIADALITKIGQEVALAKNVSSAAMQGQGFGNSGIFGNMDVTPGTGNGTVMEQMQSYLTSVQSFTKDIATLRKDHLNKAIISQLIGAGPVQGDALAQSILNDYGGVKGVNQVWGQLGKATKGLGNQAELAQYGGLKASNTSVTINVNAGAGGAASLNLTTAQIKQIVAQVQAALLKQAKRNNKTGIQLAGKGA